MFLIFLHEESYLKFLVNYIETKKIDANEEEEDSEEESKNVSSKNKALTINFLKNTKVTESDTQKVSKFMHLKELGKELKKHTESLGRKQSKMNKNQSLLSQKNKRNSIIMENNLKNQIILSLADNLPKIDSSLQEENDSLDTDNNSGSDDNIQNINSDNNNNNNENNNLNENNHINDINNNDNTNIINSTNLTKPDNPTNNIKKDITKEEITKFEKNYYIIVQGGIFTAVFGKNEKVLKFSYENLEIQFLNPQNNKFMCSYGLSEFNPTHKEGKTQIFLTFKNQRKSKNLSLMFSNFEDVSEFMGTYEILAKFRTKSKYNDFEVKDFLKKNLRRYSWLNQSLGAILPKKTSAEYSFQIINEDFSPSKQILHLNFIHKIISFLKKDKEKTTILKEFSIQKIVHLQLSYQDSRKIVLKLENKKSIGILFSSVQNKIIFESAINSILVYFIIF